MFWNSWKRIASYVIISIFFLTLGHKRCSDMTAAIHNKLFSELIFDIHFLLSSLLFICSKYRKFVFFKERGRCFTGVWQDYFNFNFNFNFNFIFHFHRNHINIILNKTESCKITLNNIVYKIILYCIYKYIFLVYLI